MRLEIASRLTETQLPWNAPLARWSGHLFISQDRRPGEEWRLNLTGGNYVALEVPAGKGRAAYDLLVALEGYGLPVATPIGLAEERERAEDLLVLQLADGATPLGDALLADDADIAAMTKATANLMVHLHLAGLAGEGHGRWRFACAKENGELQVSLIYGEGSICEEVNNASRTHDVEALLPALRMAAGEACFSSKAALDFANGTRDCYGDLWRDIDQSRLFIDDEEISVATRVTNGPVPQSQPGVPMSLALSCRVQPGSRHKMLLHMLTGLKVGSDRGKRVLQDIHRFHAWLEFSSGRKWPRALAANRWMAECFLPAISLLPNSSNILMSGRGC